VRAKTPTLVDLAWDQDLRFKVAFSASPLSPFPPEPSFVMDSAGLAGPSPVQALAAALAGCMAMDLVHIVTRGRHVIRSMTARLSADRAEEDPKRLVRAQLHFVVDSDAPQDAIDRAITLSREKYCSVWHSLRRDIELDVTFARD
jgi:putative redox protein